MSIRLILSLLLFFINFSYSENKTSGKVDIYLSVPSILSLTILTPHILLVPTPEDYAKEFNAKNYIDFTGKRIETWPPDPYPAELPGINSGWLERAQVIETVIFANSQRGATLYVYGVVPIEDRKEILHLKDCFLTVDTVRTFIWKNKLEGAAARVSTPNPVIGFFKDEKKVLHVCHTYYRRQFIPPTPWNEDEYFDINQVIEAGYYLGYEYEGPNVINEQQWWDKIGRLIFLRKYNITDKSEAEEYTRRTPNLAAFGYYTWKGTYEEVYYPLEPPWSMGTWTDEVKPELIKIYPWIDEILPQYQKEVVESYIYTEGFYYKDGQAGGHPQVPLYIQLSNPNILWIFSVSRATIAPRKVAFQIGVGNLDLYTEGNYTNNIVFILMPNV